MMAGGHGDGSDIPHREAEGALGAAPFARRGVGARPRRAARRAAGRAAAVRAGLERLGVKAGDRVAAFTPNQPEAVVAFLAASSLGAIGSSCSPDFGLQGVLDRFGQIEPTVLFGASSCLYAGKRHDL